MLLPIALAGLGCLALSNPPRRRRSKRRNPNGGKLHLSQRSPTEFVVFRGSNAHRPLRRFLTLAAANAWLKRHKAKRRNPVMPGGVLADGTRLKLKKNLETREWMIVAYVNGKRHEGKTGYFEDRDDAENTLKYMLSHDNTRPNPRRRKSKRKNPHDYALAQRLFRKHKAALTRAKNSGSPDKVIAAVNAFEADFENNNLPLPDSWSNWERAKEDALYAKQRQRPNPRRRSKRRRK